jgi:hypothetical protein
MKLIIKPTDQGQSALHTDDGEILPEQSKVTIISKPEEVNCVVVEFALIEGGDIELQGF